MGRSTSTAAARRLGVLWLGLLGAGLPAHSLTDPRWPGPIASVRPDPGPRNAHGLAYDLEAGVLVLFGGATADEVRGDTWHWRAGTWRQASYHGPPPGTFPSMVYDSARAEVVLFGGNRVLFGDDVRPPAMLGDTWVWRGGAWALAAQAGPAPRAEAAMAYDPLRRSGRCCSAAIEW